MPTAAPLPRTALGLLLALVLTAFAATAQVTWQDRTVRPLPRDSASMTFDTARGRAVLAGGVTTLAGVTPPTLEWDGTAWLRMTPTQELGARAGAAMAYDPGRGVVVAFGGLAATPDTAAWEWDGSDWQRLPTALEPGARADAAMAHDPTSGTVVLFGGWDGSTPFADTWQWDGTSWTQRQPVQSPGPRYGARLTPDPFANRLLLVGGRDASNAALAETWAWDGTGWTDLTATAAPPARALHGLCTDTQRQQVVLFGGYNAAGTASDAVWEWNGTRWSRATPGATPPARGRHAMVYDPVRARALVVGGTNAQGTGFLQDVWEWDGVAWAQRTPPVPRTVGYHSTSYHEASNSLMLYGGWNGRLVLPGTWQWDGDGWTQLNPPSSPGPRMDHAVAYDRKRARTVLFGGLRATSTPTRDTWEWDGSDWTQRFPQTVPLPRHGHAMAYDELRERVVMFGGTASGSFALRDTWEWDGSDWTRIDPPLTPHPRYWHALVWDGSRGRVLLQGGTTGIQGLNLADTWEWDGSLWSVPNSSTPGARYGHAMAWDAARSRVVLYGGIDDVGSGVLPGETWEWAGAGWLQRQPLRPAPGRRDHAMAFDGARRQVVLVDQQVLEYGPVWPASSSLFGSGCAGGAGVPALTLVGQPWLGDTVTLSLGGLPPTAPALVSGGASNTTWGGLPLPFSLAQLGAPGCDLLVSLDVVVPLPNAGGTAQVTLSLPVDPSLLGGLAYLQGFALDAAANALGLSVSNGLTLAFGAR